MPNKNKHAPIVAMDARENHPLSESAHYEIYLSDVSLQPALVTYLESIEDIRRINKSEVTGTKYEKLSPPEGNEATASAFQTALSHIKSSDYI